MRDRDKQAPGQTVPCACIRRWREVVRNNKRQRCSEKDRQTETTEKQWEGQTGIRRQRHKWTERETEKGEGLEREPGSNREREREEG